MTFAFDPLTRRLLLITHDEEVVASLEEMITEETEQAWKRAVELVQAEYDAEEDRLTVAEGGKDPYRVPLLGNWLGGLKAAVEVLTTRELSDTAQRHLASKEQQHS